MKENISRALKSARPFSRQIIFRSSTLFSLRSRIPPYYQIYVIITKMTQRQEALKGNITPQMQAVAKDEGRGPEEIRAGVAQGLIAIPYNPLHTNCKAVGVGKGLRTKVNANIGTSAD